MGSEMCIRDRLYSDLDERRDSGFTVFYMSINIGSMLGFAICGYLGERIGWHWGFGAAGVGMLFGVLQFIYFKRNLGDAGLYPNEMSESKRNSLKFWSIISIIFFSAVVITGMLGIWSIDPVFFAERFRDFLVTLSFVYFGYLFFFAGLTSFEKKNVLMLLLLFVLSLIHI